MANDEKKKLYDSPQETIKNWEALYKFYSEKFTDQKTEWVFRGDHPAPENKNALSIPEDAFKSRLERVFDDYEVKGEQRRKIEIGLIRAFRRTASLHTNYRQENWLECLALMQHYEVPTRMLDWTYSFFAAVYFAINRAKINKETKKGSRVVWALDSKWLDGTATEFEKTFVARHEEEVRKELDKLRADGRGGFENYVIHSFITEQIRCTESFTEYKEEPMVYAVNPYYLNERLSVQRGVLICPSKIDISWGENLEHMLDKEKDGKCHLWEIRIEWDDVKTQKQFLRRLYDMNISQASLFPDLDGFAKSLTTRVAMPETLGIFD